MRILGERSFVVLALVFAAAAALATVMSAADLSLTFDEPHHLATGLEWWQFGTYRWWTENPPLPKVLTALGPYLSGLRLPRPPAPDLGPWEAGIDLIAAGGAHALTLARLGTLPFLLLVLGFTFALAGGRAQPRPAFVAVALVATYPPLLGHAGLATTDVAAVATLLGFVLGWDRWAARPSAGRAAIVGAAFGLALLCKLTSLLLGGVLAAAWLAGRRAAGGRWLGVRPRARALGAQAGLAAATAFAVAWAGYRFSIGRLEDLPAMDYMGTPVLSPPGQRSHVLAWLAQVRLPAPELWHGLLFLRAHDAHGHLSYLFGHTREHGFHTFYLVGLALKSPLPFLALMIAAVALIGARRMDRAALGPRGAGAGLAALGALVFSTFVTVNIGLRHLLVVVPLLAVFAARAVVPAAEAAAPRRRVIAGAALALLLAADALITARACPELMAYFNPLAGDEPGRALIDSDLDWGQDLRLLQRALAARGVEELHYGLFAIVDPCAPGWPKMTPLEPGRPVTGWVALSEQFYRSGLHFSFRRASCAPDAPYPFHEDPADAFDWLRGAQPVARIGASIRLYHLAAR